MSGIQYRSAWGDDADGAGPQPKEVMPPVPPDETQSHQRGGPVAPPSASAHAAEGVTVSAAFLALLEAARRPHESWNAFAKRLQVPNSLLGRFRKGAGFNIASADRILQRLRATITIHWED